MTAIHIEGADKLIAKLKSLEQMNRVRAAVYESANMLRDKVAKYPSESHRPNPMLRGDSAKAKRMRAGFFARLKSGEIQVPYRRGQSPGSEKLGQRWTISMGMQGWSAVIGNNASYARLVQSSNQTSYHRHTGWITTRQTTQLYGKDAVNRIREALRQEVNS